jgi:hypothetical protein
METLLYLVNFLASSPNFNQYSLDGYITLPAKFLCTLSPNFNHYNIHLANLRMLNPQLYMRKQNYYKCTAQDIHALFIHM